MKTIQKFIYFTLIAVIVTSSISSCKKYEEGPMFSLKSKKARLEGKWIVESYMLNEEDNLNYNTTSTQNDYYCGIYEYIRTGSQSLEYEFDKNGDAKFTLKINEITKYDYQDGSYCSDNETSNSDTTTYFGEWEFRNDKKELKLKLYTENEYGYTNYVRYDYEIIRLTDDEIKLKGYFDEGKHELTLKKQ